MKQYISMLAISMSLSVAMAANVSAAETKSQSYKEGSEPKELRTVAPDRARFVFIKPKFTSGGPAAVTCCTNWNSSTGGTGCASFEDSCPDDQFQVDCGDDGCW